MSSPNNPVVVEQQRGILKSKPSVSFKSSTTVDSNLTGAKSKTSLMPTFRVDLKYRNTLPGIPFDPKFLELPFLESDFLVSYKQSTLERNYNYRIHLNPPTLKDDMIDPLGNEEWCRSIELDERDKNLLRKEGAPSTLDASMRFDDVNNRRTNRRRNKTAVVKQPWLLKTLYTQDNEYTVAHTTTLEEGEGEEEESVLDEEEALLAKKRLILRQFEAAKKLQQEPQQGGKRVFPLVPHNGLREHILHCLRFKPEEKTGLDDHLGVLVRRRTAETAFSPLTMFVTNPKEEDDLFADEDEDELELHVDRDYSVETLIQDNRFGLFWGSDAVKYVELEKETFKLFRAKRLRKDQEDSSVEKHVKLQLRTELLEEEKQERQQRRETIENGT